jgi:predicted transposase YbfD/YdcC
VLESLGFDLRDKDFTWDALLTQRSIVEYVRSQLAHYHAPVKGNQPTLLKDLEDQFNSRSPVPDFQTISKGHGRLETRSIWTTEKLNGYLEFPDVAQVYLIERKITNVKTQVTTCELAYGVTSRPASEASPKRMLEINRGHWTIENSCHYVLDATFDEDRSRIRKGYGPENFTALRRFAIGLIQSKGKDVAETTRLLNRRPRMVLDYLLMTENSRRCSLPAAA